MAVDTVVSEDDYMSRVAFDMFIRYCDFFLDYGEVRDCSDKNTLREQVVDHASDVLYARFEKRFLVKSIAVKVVKWGNGVVISLQ